MSFQNKSLEDAKLSDLSKTAVNRATQLLEIWGIEKGRRRKILVTGDRNWDDYQGIHSVLDDLQESITVVIHGGARGADNDAEVACFHLQITSKPYPADWEKYGKSAGPIRNQQMLDENPDLDLVLAFHDSLSESKGTKDMVERAMKKGIKVIHYKHVLVMEELN